MPLTFLCGTPIYIPGLGQCGTVASYWDRRTFVCRAAFRGPGRFLSEGVNQAHRNRWRDSYSPFPAEPTIVPALAETFALKGEQARETGPQAPERPLTIEVREPAAYFRYTMEASNVRLADYAIEEAGENSKQ
jgi:hypothetical protein